MRSAERPWKRAEELTGERGWARMDGRKDAGEASGGRGKRGETGLGTAPRGTTTIWRRQRGKDREEWSRADHKGGGSPSWERKKERAKDEGKEITTETLKRAQKERNKRETIKRETIERETIKRETIKRETIKRETVERETINRRGEKEGFSFLYFLFFFLFLPLFLRFFSSQIGGNDFRAASIICGQSPDAMARKKSKRGKAKTPRASKTRRLCPTSLGRDRSQKRE